MYPSSAGYFKFAVFHMNTCMMIGFVFPTYFLQVPVFKPEPYSRAQYAYLRISVTWLRRDAE